MGPRAEPGPEPADRGAGLLYQVTERFANINLHPGRVDNHQMGLVFEELIPRVAAISNETAGEHFTPRDAIRRMVNLLFVEDDEVLARPGVVRTIYDPTAGTGGMLSVAGEYLAELNPQARLTMVGQELDPESYAICKAGMLIKGQDVSNPSTAGARSSSSTPATSGRRCARAWAASARRCRRRTSPPSPASSTSSPRHAWPSSPVPTARRSDGGS